MAKKETEINKIINKITYKKVLLYPVFSLIISIILFIIGMLIKDSDLLAILTVFFLIGITPLAAIGSAFFGIGAFVKRKEQSLLFSSIVVILIGVLSALSIYLINSLL